MSLNKKTGINVVHASTNTLACLGLKGICSRGGGVKGLKSVSSHDELDSTLKKEVYDIVVIDTVEDGEFKPHEIVLLKDANPDIPFLLISECKNENIVLNLLEKGVQGFLTYECDEDEILHAIFSLAKGDKFYCNKVLDMVLNQNLKLPKQESCEPTSLSEREMEIAKLISQGNTSRKIAEQLFISPHTVQTHRKNIMKKLGVSSASELTIYCISIGLVQAPYPS